MSRLRDERGQVLVMTAFCMACLLGALGLAVDCGVLFNARRQMQTAADAAAMAAATESFYNGSGSANISTRELTTRPRPMASIILLPASMSS